MSIGKALFTKTNIIIFGAVGLIMLYGVFVFVRTKYFGAEIGASCAESSDCKGAGAWCTKTPDGTARFCTRRCVSDEACPGGWTCGDSGYKEALTKSTGTVGVAHAVNVCWQPGKGKAPPFRN